MGRKSYQSSSRYAKQAGNKPKRKGPQRPKTQTGASATSQQMNTVETAQIRPGQQVSVAKNRTAVAGIATTYAYVASDLKRTFIIAGLLFVVLIVLVFVLG